MTIRWWEEEVLLSGVVALVFSTFLLCLIEDFKENICEKGNRDVGDQEAGTSGENQEDGPRHSLEGRGNQEGESGQGGDDRPLGFDRPSIEQTPIEVKFAEIDGLVKGIKGG